MYYEYSLSVHRFSNQTCASCKSFSFFHLATFHFCFDHHFLPSSSGPSRTNLNLFLFPSLSFFLVQSFFSF